MRAQVIVTEGDLKQLLGRVTGVLEDGRVEMLPTMEGLDQALTFEPRQLQKYFQARRAGAALRCYPSQGPTNLSGPRACSLQHNFLALQAACPAGLPA
jgi:hypothetical protein